MQPHERMIITYDRSTASDKDIALLQKLTGEGDSTTFRRGNRFCRGEPLDAVVLYECRRPSWPPVPFYALLGYAHGGQ